MTCTNKQYSTIQLRRGSDAEFTSSDPVLASGEPAFAVDTNTLKIGDGTTLWSNLSPIGGGVIVIPTGSIDLHNGGVQNAQLFQFDNTSYQSVITGPTPASGSSAQRIIIQGQRALGSGEGGDAYLWGGDSNINGGDIKIYAGDADDPSTGQGGYVNIDGGNGYDQGGNIGITAGNSTLQGGDVTIMGGSPSGTVMLSSDGGSHDWLFNHDGSITFPDSTIQTTAWRGQAESIVTTVFNKTGSPIPKMSAVYIDGGQGDKPTVKLAIATGDTTSAGTYGITSEAISNMSTGKVVVMGALSGVNTDPAHGGIAGATEGSVLYLSPTTSGALTTTKPSAPNHIVTLGNVVRVHQNEGIVEVRIANGFELDELHNVAISGVTNGQFLQYNSGTALWVPTSSGNFSTLLVNGTGVSVNGHTHTSSDITNFNSTVSGLLPTISNSGDNRILTSDGTSTGVNAESNLSFDGSIFLVSGSIRLGDTAGNRVQFFKGGGAIYDYSIAKEGNHLAVSTANDGSTFRYTQFGYHSGSTWTPKSVINNYNGSIGINTTSPTHTLHIVGSGYVNGYLDVDNLRLDGNTISSTNSNGNIVLAPSGTGDVQVDADTLRVGDSNSAATITSNGTGNLTISTNSGTNSGSIVINQGVNGNISITPNGTGEVDLSKVDIDGGSIDGTAIGATSASTGKFTQLYPTVVSNGNVSGSVATDVSTGQIFDMTVTGSTTLSNPTNSIDGVTVRWRILQDGTGGHSIALGSDFQIPSSASSPLPWSTAANAMDILAATYHAGRAKWDVVAFVPGY